MEGNIFNIFVLKRPGVEEFIAKISKLYELVVFTASMSQYANPLLNKLDPCHLIKHRLFREHCKFIGDGFVKDLSLLGRDLKNVIIVDNTPFAYRLHPLNAVPISSWFYDKDDIQLYDLYYILKLLSFVDDVILLIIITINKYSTKKCSSFRVWYC